MKKKWIILILFLAVVMAGCSSEEITEDQLVGSWESADYKKTFEEEEKPTERKLFGARINITEGNKLDMTFIGFTPGKGFFTGYFTVFYNCTYEVAGNKLKLTPYDEAVNAEEWPNFTIVVSEQNISVSFRDRYQSKEHFDLVKLF